MNKTELKHQLKDLYNVLLECIDHSPNVTESMINIAKKHSYLEHRIDSGVYLRKIKKRKLENEFIKKFNSLDIQEALNIDIKEARKKRKNFDFTTKEKNTILNNFKGDSKKFLERYDGEVMN